MPLRCVDADKESIHSLIMSEWRGRCCGMSIRMNATNHSHQQPPFGRILNSQVVAQSATKPRVALAA